MVDGATERNRINEEFPRAENDLAKEYAVMDNDQFIEQGASIFGLHEEDDSLVKGNGLVVRGVLDAIVNG
jgi:hypothetical protein